MHVYSCTEFLKITTFNSDSQNKQAKRGGKVTQDAHKRCIKGVSYSMLFYYPSTLPPTSVVDLREST